LHALNKTQSITTSFDDVKIAKMFSRDAWTQQLLMDREMALHKSYYLFWIWLNKLSWMTEAIKANPFDTDIFVWRDIGSLRGHTYNSDRLVRNLDMISNDKMLIMASGPPHDVENGVENGDVTNKFDGIFRNRDWYTAGAVLAGYKHTVVAMEAMFLQTIQECHAHGLFIGDDQSLLQSTCVQNNICEFVTPYHVQGDKWFGLHYALHTDNVISLWKPTIIPS